MKFFICKNCGHTDLTSSDSWKVGTKDLGPDTQTILQCPKCEDDRLLSMEITITDIPKK